MIRVSGCHSRRPEDCGDGDVAVRTGDRHWSAGLVSAGVGESTCRRRAAPSQQHVIVYREPGRFAGWPANHGMWSWGDEILVGFSRGYYKDRGPFHHINKEKPEEFLLARSQDGGATWSVEQPPPPRCSGRHAGHAPRAHAAGCLRPSSPPIFTTRSISPIPTSP